MTDLLSIWREARGPEPELPLWDCGLGAHRWSYSSEAMRAHYAAAVTEDALARFAERIRAAERERCAKLCEDYAWLQEEGSPARSNFRNCAEGIRRAT